MALLAVAVKAATAVLMLAAGLLIFGWFWATPAHVTVSRYGETYSVECGQPTAIHEAVDPIGVVGGGPEARCHQHAVERVVAGGAAGAVFVVGGVAGILVEITKRRNDQLRWWFNRKLLPDRMVWSVFIAVAVGWGSWLISQGITRSGP